MKPQVLHRVLMDVLDQHGERLLATLTRLTLNQDVASDLFQELFVRLGGNIAFVNAADPAAYAWRSAINLAMEWRRKRKRDSGYAEPMNHADAIPSNDRHPLDAIVRDEEMELLLNHLSELTDLTREAFVLRFIENQSYEAVAQKIAKTPHQVRGLCHAALQQLKEKLAPNIKANHV